MTIEVTRPRLNCAWLTGLCAINAAMMAASPAAGQWTAIRVHPAGATDSRVHAVWGSQQGGGSTPASLPTGNASPGLWSGSAGSWSQLGSGFGEVLGMDATRQVGHFQGGASIWYGTPESRASLHPAGSTGASEAKAVRGDQQVGWSGWGLPSPGMEHASLWRGSAASFVDLHPAGAERSVANATDGTLQGGMASVPGLHAALWSGTASSFVDFNPGAGYTSTILGMAPGQQVGWSQLSTQPQHAAIWNGTASSWLDVHPFPGFGASFLYATTGGVQVGFSHMPGSGLTRAGIWSGTAASFHNLHQYLPTGYSASTAYAVYEDASGIVVGGLAVNSATGRSEAFIWTTVPAPGTASLLAMMLLAPRRRR